MTAGIAVHRELCFKLGRLFAAAAAEAMFGFFAEATTRRIKIDGVEISDAAWFSPRQLPSLPPPYTISRDLIETHLARWR